MFSGTKQITDDRRARLGSKVFEELTIMGSAWGPGLYDAAAWNAMQVEEVDLLEFEEMLVDDADIVKWDKFDNDVAWGDSFELEVWLGRSRILY
jgi:hypothetical protein